MLSIDLDAVFYWAQEAARRMLAAKKQGSIVNIASVLGFGVAKGVAAYATAKTAVMQVTRALAVELAFKGVRVNAIAPGWFVTEINDKYLESEAGAAIRRDIVITSYSIHYTKLYDGNRARRAALAARPHLGLDHHQSAR